jgi:hypothetical protein
MRCLSMDVIVACTRILGEDDGESNRELVKRLL